MKRETEYYAEFLNQDYETVRSFLVSAHNPKQAVNRAFDKFNGDLTQVERVVIRLGSDIKV